MSLAVLIPAYQAEASIADVVRRSRALFPRVYVVDDGSTDLTAAAAAAAGAHVRAHPHNMGKGAALRTGWQWIRSEAVEWMLTLDADGQHIPEQLPRLMDVAQQADLVLGARTHQFATMSRVRRAANTLSSRAISFAAGVRIADVQTGFRAYRRTLLDAVGFRENRFQAESALVVRAARRGFRILSTPVDLAEADGRLTSHYRPFMDSWRIAVAVTRARFDYPSAPATLQTSQDPSVGSS